MRRIAPLAALVAALCLVPALAARKAPDLKLTIHQSPEPAKAGQKVKLSIEVAPPEGIKLNQYPGITLTLVAPAGITLDSKESFAGTRTPIDDPAQFGFKTTPKLDVSGTVTTPGAKTIEGTMKFFYCVKASDFCAPGEIKVSIPVKIAG